MTARPLFVPENRRRFDAMIGVGGVGTGMFFAVNGNSTLDREESRSGRIEEGKDYCKLHIVSHYVKTLLGGEFRVVPIGRVGDDDTGRTLLQEMDDAGICIGHLKVCEGTRTLFSFCLRYPDGSGGNLTTDDSACSKLTPEDVDAATEEFFMFGKRGIGIALPEVPLSARKALLELSTHFGLYRIASFTSKEMEMVKEEGFLDIIDLLAVNLDEACRLSGGTCIGSENERTVDKAVNLLAAQHPRLSLSVTAGKNGSFLWDTDALHHLRSVPVKAKSSAGAGDAFLAGIITGVAAGLDLCTSQMLATLVGAFSVTSPHTIHKGIDRETLKRFASETEYPLQGSLRALF